MSLVIGYADETIGFLIGDTKLSFEYGTPQNEILISGQAHTLKIRILDQKNAVAFAGNNVPAAIELIANIITALKVNAALDIPRAIAALYSDDIASDFLVLRLTDEGPKLTKIQEGIISDCILSYIGDQNEYRKFAEIMEATQYSAPATQSVQQPDGSFVVVPLVQSEGEVLFAKADTAMQRLTADWNDNSTVGAISAGVTRVCDARLTRNLEYLQSVCSTTSPAEGKSGYHWMASNKGTFGMAVYYPLGRMGLLFIVGDTKYGRKEYADTKDAFVALAKEKYSLNLE